MATKRPRNAIQTRADILAAARRRFGAEGYERTTLRAIAADVGVDAALVIHYFGSKQDLFAEAADFSRREIRERQTRRTPRRNDCDRGGGLI
jgi:AcrR family transcriptional regulator